MIYSFTVLNLIYRVVWSEPLLNKCSTSSTGNKSCNLSLKKTLHNMLNIHFSSVIPFHHVNLLPLNLGSYRLHKFMHYLKSSVSVIVTGKPLNFSSLLMMMLKSHLTNYASCVDCTISANDSHNVILFT